VPRGFPSWYGKFPTGDGRIVGLLRRTPGELAARHAIAFTNSLDDLYFHEFAGIRLPSGRPILFLAYAHPLPVQTNVLADIADDPVAARRELLDMLGLEEDAFSWTTDEPPFDAEEYAALTESNRIRRQMTSSPAHPPIILASQSPRRAELIARLELIVDVLPADIDESYRQGETPPEHAERLAREKAEVIARAHPHALVVGSDTIVVVDGDVLGKPRDRAHAVEMLMRLSGREHEVCTGVAIAHGERVESGLERVRVRFRALDRALCEAYVDTGEPMDKAGAYGIQGFGSAIVEGIEGDYFAVMGLPVVRMLGLFERFGWRYRFGKLVAT